MVTDKVNQQGNDGLFQSLSKGQYWLVSSQNQASEKGWVDRSSVNPYGHDKGIHRQKKKDVRAGSDKALVRFKMGVCDFTRL